MIFSIFAAMLFATPRHIQPFVFLFGLSAMVFVESSLLAGGVIFARWLLGLTCPSCGAPLVTYSQYDGTVTIGGRVVVTKYCACGRLLVDNGVSISASLPLSPASPALFLERRDKLDSGSTRDYATSVIVGVSGLVGGCFAAKVLISRGATLLGIVAPILTLAAVLLFIASLLNRWEARARALGLTCPQCGALLVGGAQDSTTHAVLATGKCPQCHASLWAHETNR